MKESIMPMLHYFLKNKQPFFEACLMTSVFIQIAPQINAIFNSDETVLRR
jgi:hypothetical protein